MDRASKSERVESLRDIFGSTSSVVVVQHTGLSVAEMTDLRTKMRAAGARLKVTKNRLARRALEGTKFGSIAELFKGPTAVAFSSDPVAAAKVAVNYAKGNDKVVILGGALDARRLDTAGIQALAKLPSLDEQRGMLIGLIQAPASKIARVVQAPAGQLARVFAAYSKKSDSAAA